MVEGRGAENGFVNSLISHNACGKKRDKADNAFGEIHQSGQFPIASDFSVTLGSFIWALGKSETLWVGSPRYNRCQVEA